MTENQSYRFPSLPACNPATPWRGHNFPPSFLSDCPCCLPCSCWSTCRMLLVLPFFCQLCQYRFKAFSCFSAPSSLFIWDLPRQHCLPTRAVFYSKLLSSFSKLSLDCSRLTPLSCSASSHLPDLPRGCVTLAGERCLLSNPRQPVSRAFKPQLKYVFPTSAS